MNIFLKEKWVYQYKKFHKRNQNYQFDNEGINIRDPLLFINRRVDGSFTNHKSLSII